MGPFHDQNNSFCVRYPTCNTCIMLNVSESLMQLGEPGVVWEVLDFSTLHPWYHLTLELVKIADLCESNVMIWPLYGELSGFAASILGPFNSAPATTARECKLFILLYKCLSTHSSRSKSTVALRQCVIRPPQFFPVPLTYHCPTSGPLCWLSSLPENVLNSSLHCLVQVFPFSVRLSQTTLRLPIPSNTAQQIPLCLVCLSLQPVSPSQTPYNWYLLISSCLSSM